MKFDIEKFSRFVRVSRVDQHYDYERSQVYEVAAYFAKGNQIKTVHEESKQTHKTIDVPATPTDWLKSLITAFEPTLNFGWLKPRYKTLEKEVTVQINEQYINVYPVELSDPALRDRCVFFPSPYTWLTGEPPTQRDVDLSREKIQERKWNALSLAPWVIDDVVRDMRAKEDISKTSLQ